MVSGTDVHQKNYFFIFYFLFFIFYFLPYRTPITPATTVIIQHLKHPTMSTTTDCTAIAPTTATSQETSRLTESTATFLSTASGENVFRQTQADVRAVDGKDRREAVGRNQGIIDVRTKNMQGRLTAKVQRRKVQRCIDQLDVLMQKLLESQEPANEALYDLYAHRKSQYEAVL
jgi:hypothetical protein